MIYLCIELSYTVAKISNLSETTRIIGIKNNKDMRTLKYNKRGICRMAYGFINGQGMTQSETMRKAWAVAKLQERMRDGIVQFFYIKKSTGELRQAFGTTDPHRYDYTPSGTGRKGSYTDCIQYYDTEKRSFRMFKSYNLVNVMA